MRKLSAFRKAVLTTLSEVPSGYMQRIDGLECFTPGEWWFFRRRVKWMERDRLVRSRSTRSFWPSANGLPAYVITPAGRSALAEGEKRR